MKSFKKSILNVCNKLIAAAPATKPEPIITNLVLKRKSLARSSLGPNRSMRSHYRHQSVTNMSPSITASSPSSSSTDSYDAVVTANGAQSTTSSGYGTLTTTTAESVSVAQPVNSLSVFVNLDNYFYDENFSKYKDRAHESALEQKRHVVESFLEYEMEYLDKLRRGIEVNVRPLSVVLSEAVFFDLFQNIEKICSVSEFIKKAIDDSMLLTHDIYKSTVTIIHEYISIMMSTYELYVQGFPKALQTLEAPEIADQLTDLANDLDLLDLIQLPIDNITKTYCAFTSLLEMTPVVDQDDYEKLNTISSLMKNLISANLDDDVESVADNSMSHEDIREITVIKYDVPARAGIDKRLTNAAPKSALPRDFTDYDGYKHYFL